MPPISRRIFLYWLLLLVPTLAVGAGAILLLQREQKRLAERSEYAEEARRAAAAARTRLIVENVELLVGDVQTGLLDTLAAEPAEGLDDFLARWEMENPLVRTAFRATAAGNMLWPDPRVAGEEARGFLRRFEAQFGGRPPWGTELALAKDAALKREEAESKARQEIGANIAQLQSARRDVQELVKAPSYSNRAGASAAEASADYAAAPSAERYASGVADERRPTDLSDRAARVQRSAAAPAARAKATVAVTGSAERRGWAPFTVSGRLHLLGWVQPAGDDAVRGVEVELAAVIAKLASALPAEVNEVEGYALRDDQGRVMHQIGAIPSGGAPTFRVPLSSATLPGWEAVVFLTLPRVSFNFGTEFFWVTVLLVAIFVAAILAGGSLLLWQARRSELEAAQKTSFVANVSHEFKTPLTTIRLYSELLEQGRVRDASQGTEYLRTIGRETQRLARLVNNALDFSRLEQGRKKYAREPVDLTVELGRLLDTHAPRLADAGLVLRRELPSTPLHVETDRDALEQIVLNLLDNACKYASGGGEITVSARARVAAADGPGRASVLQPPSAGDAEATARPAPYGGRGAVICVADRGPGVPAEHRERIFEKFHRVDDALTAEKTGAGLGLSIARQLARGMGGELRCVAREGGGAEFVLEMR